MGPARGAAAALLALTVLAAFDAGAGAPSAEFSRHRTVVPSVQRPRDKRHITHTRHTDGLHHDELTITLPVDGAQYVLDLRLNTQLVPRNHTVAYKKNGEDVVYTPGVEELDLCQYSGKIRDVEGSWVAVSTCRGLKGMMYDGRHYRYIESAGDGGLNSPHYLYHHSDLTETHSCGYRGGITNNSNFDKELFDSYHRERALNRIRRSGGSVLRGPYNANRQSRYVELALVIDYEGYKASESMGDLYRQCKDIANIINAMYSPLNIFVALVTVRVWSEGDEIALVDNGDDTLTNFLHYRRKTLLLQTRNDNAQLLTRHKFNHGVVGKALKGTMCTYEYSGGINTNHSNVIGLVATTIAHEMGHNFGMEHDSEEDCECPDAKCIMSPSSNSQSPAHWSSCSLKALALAFEHGLDYCLRNKPTALFDSPTCGNGFVEEGEECDCGAAGGACASCCRADTCMLRGNATCATGECCDLTRCAVRAAGSECRGAGQECDLPEYCTGHSEFCPADVHKMDSQSCDDGKAYCYRGSCRSHTDQCRLLWGSSGTRSHDKCYAMNVNGSRYGNCGSNRLSADYVRCAREDVLCGMLHCRHLNEQLEFGVESVSTLSHTFININGTIIPCRTAVVDLGLDQTDPGLVPDGAKCGQEKMCVHQKCVPVGAVRADVQRIPGSVCPSDCSGHGICNSRGNCHCERGFGPPLCALPGPGGSVDSGPSTDPSVQHNFMVAMYIIFLGVIPSVVLLLFLSYYSRHNILLWWKRPRKPSQSPKKGSLQRRLSRGASKFAANFQSNHGQNQTVPPLNVHSLASPDDMSSSLLRSDSDANSPTGNINPSISSVSFFGHFKGFSLTPLEKAQVNATQETVNAQPVSVISGLKRNENGFVQHGSTSKITENVAKIVPVHKNNAPNSVVHQNSIKAPVRSAPPVPVVPQKTESPKLDIKRHNSTVQSRIKALMSTEKTENIFPLNNPAPRPTISSPILEASTCTAKELMSPLHGSKTLGPIRTAPSVPKASPDLPKRPLSIGSNVYLKPLPDEPVSKKPKEGISLNRIASFLKQEKPKDKNRNPVERSHSLPKNPINQVKVIKTVDKVALRNLQISNPILQKDIELPASAVSVGSDSEDLDDPKQFVARAHSMRGPSVAQRPNIPTFGSMRQPSGVTRPNSIILGNRPTSPPPPRPDQPKDTNAIPGLPGYQNPKLKSTALEVKSPEYVDCISEKQAPLANINEESPGDNIYAVIEENPLIKSARMSSAPIKTLPQIPPEGYNTPKPVGGSNSGSSESMGLLGEIVNEIQHRNFDSIYSTSTLARKKREREKKLGIKPEDENDNQMYANTDEYRAPESEYSNTSGPKSSAASTTSSGYLHPSAVNVPRFLNNNPEASATAPQTTAKPIETIDKPTEKPPSSPILKGPNSKIPTLGRQLTPPGLRLQNSTFRNVPSSPKNIPKLGTARSIVNSPDVVSSCTNGSTKTGKSPDVVNSNGSKSEVSKVTPKPSSVPAKSTDKPPIKSALSVDKKVIPKTTPTLKPVSSTSSLGVVQKIQTVGNAVTKNPKLEPTAKPLADLTKKPKPVPKPSTISVQRTDSTLGKPNLSKRPSNVASLQQKFENRKSLGKEPAAKK